VNSERILTAHQPAYLPWLGLFHKIALSDVYVFMDNVQYSTSDKFINRNYIKRDDGEKCRLTVPLKNTDSQNINISGLEIGNSQDWQRKHLMSIQRFYTRSKFGKEYFPEIEGFYKKEYSCLKDLCFEMLEYFLGALGIETKVVKASELGIHSSKNKLLIDYCNSLECSVYIFGEEGGKSYADAELWKKSGLKYYVQEYKQPAYEQQWGNFVSHLSIIDLLLNEGKEKALEIIMKGNAGREDVLKA